MIKRRLPLLPLIFSFFFSSSDRESCVAGVPTALPVAAEAAGVAGAAIRDG